MVEYGTSCINTLYMYRLLYTFNTVVGMADSEGQVMKETAHSIQLSQHMHVANE